MTNPQHPALPNAWAPQQQTTRPPAAASHQSPSWPNTPLPQHYPMYSPHPQGPRYTAAPYPPASPFRATGEPIFTVHLRKHTGLMLVWLSQSYSVTGTFHQCEAAIKDAQRHNLTLGWWSVASIVLWNWIALGENANARKALRHNASHYGYVPASR